MKNPCSVFSICAVEKQTPSKTKCAKGGKLTKGHKGKPGHAQNFLGMGGERVEKQKRGTKTGKRHESGDPELRRLRGMVGFLEGINSTSINCKSNIKGKIFEVT